MPTAPQTPFSLTAEIEARQKAAAEAARKAELEAAAKLARDVEARNTALKRTLSEGAINPRIFAGPPQKQTTPLEGSERQG